MKKTAIIAIVISIIAIGFAGIALTKKTNDVDVVGNIFSEKNAYSGGITYSTSTLDAGVATSLVSRATTTRNYVEICHLTGGIIYLYKQATSTGIVVGMGKPLFASTTDTSCARWDEYDPYTGQVWGIGSVTSTVSVETKQE